MICVGRGDEQVFRWYFCKATYLFRGLIVCVQWYLVF
jgi:hypothetical protein